MKHPEKRGAKGKKSGKKVKEVPKVLRKPSKTYRGSLEGCVFTTVKGVTGYYEDAAQAMKAKKRRADEATSRDATAAAPPA